jgi:hypothetical protein
MNIGGRFLPDGRSSGADRPSEDEGLSLVCFDHAGGGVEVGYGEVALNDEGGQDWRYGWFCRLADRRQ